jgi:hypothetical protein
MSVDLLAASVSTVLESTAPPSARAASAVPTSVVLSPEQWRDREARHQARADALSAGRRARSGTGAIETPDGKAHYVRAQREFAERGNVLRGRLIAAVAPLLPEAPLPMRVSTGGARKI